METTWRIFLTEEVVEVDQPIAVVRLGPTTTTLDHFAHNVFRNVYEATTRGAAAREESRR